MKGILKRFISSPGTLILNLGTLIVVGLLFVAQAAGAVPSAAPAQPQATSQTVISYQGMLTDQDGNLLNQAVTMQFALYDAATDGSLLWGPETQAVEISNGLFHVLLGSVTPINPGDMTGDLYLAITVNGEPLLPREQIVGNIVSWLAVSGTLSMGSSIDMNSHNINLGGDARVWTNATDTVRIYTPDGVPVGFQNAEIRPNRPIDMTGHNIELGGGARIWTNSTDTVRIYTPDETAFGFQNTEFRPNRNINMGGNSVVNCGALTEANLQTEEELAAERIDRFEEGDVLCWGDGQLERCDQAGDSLVQAVADGDGRPIVIGAELAKVIGPVKRGDFLVASNLPGYAMATAEPAFGTVIAQALENFQGDRGTIKAMIRKM